MKLIQLNIWQGRLILNVTRFLEQSQPDILCLQEVCDSPDEKSYFFDNIAEIQEVMHYPHVFFSPTYGMNIGDVNFQFGNAILSRVPLDAVKTVFLNGAYLPHAKRDGDVKDLRNFQHGTVTKDGFKTHIINHHGHWTPGVKIGDAETMRQMDVIADYIKTLDGPVIFTGDLNLLPESPSLTRLNAEMTNLCITYDVKTTRNFTSYNLTQVCDYIFVNDQVKVDSFIVHDDVVSDHSMLELNFGQG